MTLYLMYTVQPRLSEPRLSEPSIIRTSSQAKSIGQSTDIGYDIDMRMCSRVQCNHHSSCSLELQLEGLK